MSESGSSISVETTKRVPLKALVPYPANPRQGNIEAIVESLRAHGQYRALVVNKSTGQVLAGNHTLAALRKIGATEALVHYVDVDETEAAQIVLVDNRANDLAAYDDAALLELLQALPDLSGTGYGDDDLADLLKMLAPDQRTSGDTEPCAPPAHPKTQPGDLWVLGDHRLLCGDSTERLAVVRLLGEGYPDLVVTDPPYGIAYESAGRAIAAGKRGARAGKHQGIEHAPIANDALSAVATQKLVATAMTLTNLKPGGAFYVTCPPGDLQYFFMQALIDAGLPCRHGLVWVKDQMVFGRADYHYQHETILYGWREGAGHYFLADRTQTSAWEIARPKRSDEHPTMKPVELFERMIANSSRFGETVYDPFVGSGTTLIACENLGRSARAMELDARYVDVIVDRWERHTGRTATLET